MNASTKTGFLTSYVVVWVLRSTSWDERWSFCWYRWHCLTITFLPHKNMFIEPVLFKKRSGKIFVQFLKFSTDTSEIWPFFLFDQTISIIKSQISLNYIRLSSHCVQNQKSSKINWNCYCSCRSFPISWIIKLFKMLRIFIHPLYCNISHVDCLRILR